MKNKSLLSVLVGMCIMAFCACTSAPSAENKAKADSSLNESTDNSKFDPNLEYDVVLKAQDSAMANFEWPKKHEIDLNDDGKKELFLAAEGYSRGANYVLYTSENSKWKNICGAETIAGSHNEIEVLATKNNGWHDFKAIQASGREGIIESYYTWNGSVYILKDQKEVDAK